MKNSDKIKFKKIQEYDCRIFGIDYDGILYSWGDGNFFPVRHNNNSHKFSDMSLEFHALFIDNNHNSYLFENDRFEKLYGNTKNILCGNRNGFIIKNDGKIFKFECNSNDSFQISVKNPSKTKFTFVMGDGYFKNNLLLTYQKHDNHDVIINFF